MTHRPLLDGLRGVAIMMVLLEHFGGYVGSTLHSGYFGVDLFFVLSGFLITGILLREKGLSSKVLVTFAGRRALRIFPLYFLLLAVLWISDFPFVRRELFWLVTYLWNYRIPLITEGDWILGEVPPAYLWSLSVEEQFYVFWPFVVLLLAKRRVHFIIVAGVFAVLGLLQIAFGLIGFLDTWNYLGLPSRMGALALGGLIAALGRCGAVKIPPWLVIGAGGALVLMPFEAAWRFPVVTCAFGVLTHAAASGDTGFIRLNALLSSSLLRYIGKISYGIYLLHIPIAYYFVKWIFDPWWVTLPWDEFGFLQVLRWHSWLIKLPICSVLAVGAASASWFWFERPILSLKERWFSVQRVNISS